MTTPTSTPPAPPREASATVSDKPFIVKMRQLEKDLQAQGDAKNAKSREARHRIQAMLDDMQRVEGIVMAGANPRTPRGQMLSKPLGEASVLNPDLHVRWINEKAPGRVDLVQGLGYRKLAPTEGGAQLGESALYGIPRERYGELEAAKRIRTESQLKQPRDDVREVMERVVDEINSRYGTSFKTRDILIDEES